MIIETGLDTRNFTRMTVDFDEEKNHYLVIIKEYDAQAPGVEESKHYVSKEEGDQIFNKNLFT